MNSGRRSQANCITTCYKGNAKLVTGKDTVIIIILLDFAQGIKVFHVHFLGKVNALNLDFLPVKEK